MQSLAGIDVALSRAVEGKEVPGVVAMAATDTGVIYEGAFGLRDIVDGPAMTRDSVFRIASMTKAVTSVAAMQLVQQGKLKLDESAMCSLNWPLPRSWRASTPRARHDCARPNARSRCAIC